MRVRRQMALETMRENVTLQPRDIVNTVTLKNNIGEGEVIVQVRLSSPCSKRRESSQTIADLLIPDELKEIICWQYDVGDRIFLIRDSKADGQSAERILIFASYSMRQHAAVSKELYADGTYRAVSNIFATLYTIHTTIDDVSYPIFFVLMPDELSQTFKRAFNVIKQYMHSFNKDSVVHVDCQLAAINAFKDVFNCDVRISLFRQNQAVWKAVLRFGLAGAYNSISQPRLHIWIRRLLSLPFLPVDVISSEFERLFERDALSGSFSVEEQFKDNFRELVRYYKDFWMSRIPVVMWSQHASARRTNNVCEGFHSGLRQIVGIAHPNQFVTIQLLRRVDNEATRRFENYLSGNVLKRIRRRSLELEERIGNVADRYDKTRIAINPKQFLNNFSSVYLEFYHNKKLSRRDISLNVVALSKRHMDEIAAVLEEQNRYDPLDDSVGGYDFVERDTATEIFFDTVVDTTLSGDVPMEINGGESPLDGDYDVNVASTDPHTGGTGRTKGGETGKSDKTASQAQQPDAMP